MSIRTRVLLFQLVVAAAIAGMAVAVYVTIANTNYYLERITLAHRALGVMTELAIDANRHAEQIAELLLIGDAQRSDFEGAREKVRQDFNRLSSVINDEIDFVRDPAEREKEREELAALNELRTLYRETDKLVTAAVLLDKEGRRDEVVALYQSEIEYRFDAEFERRLAALVEDERQEVADTERQVAALSRRLATGTAATSVILLGISLAAGHVLARSLARPVAALAEAAAAIGRGELDHRVAYVGGDELGQLARRFDAMAAELAAQRARLVAAGADLERQVAQRTEQLASANRQLADLDRLRVRFIAEISHELRTPLTVLRGEAEVALRGRSAPVEVYREALARVVEQAVDMARLVDDLLFLARAEADQVRFERRRVDLRDVLADAAREGQALARRRSVRLETERPDGPLPVDADPQRLKQAFVVLLDNAVTYSEPSQEVALAVAADGDGWIEVVVRDRGPGVAAEDLPYVFDRFYRGRDAAARSVGGSGLGLPIAKWIVDKHGGEIALASGQGGGKGTIVRVRLPRAA